MSDQFYRAFEDQFRGSRMVIKTRLSVYLPYLHALQKSYPEAAALDLGCGRGEWLELLGEAGFQAVGVDLDAGMLEATREQGLHTIQGDALRYLKELPPESQAVVSAFHLVEHISFEQLGLLVTEALRVLKPGGLLILETPNCENLLVATQNFYLDPTHDRPIPSSLLRFMAVHAGFDRVKTLGLQEDPSLFDKPKVTLNDVLVGPSPDYAIIAQKGGADALLAPTASLFANDGGLRLGHLLGAYEYRIQQLESLAERAEIRAEQAEAHAQQAEAHAQQVEAQAQQAYAHANEAHIKIAKLTSPLRAARKILSGDLSPIWRLLALLRTILMGSPVFEGLIRMFKRALGHAVRLATHFPGLRRCAVSVIRYIPGLKPWLLKQHDALIESESAPSGAASSRRSVPRSFDVLSPRAQRIYGALEAAYPPQEGGPH
jgi:SAM-dependent methyltransferase